MARTLERAVHDILQILFSDNENSRFRLKQLWANVNLRAWLKVRGSFPGPIFLSKQKRPIALRFIC